MIIENIMVRIVDRIGADPVTGEPAHSTEIFYEFDRDGVHLCALTRVPWAVADSPHSRACERAAFIRRQNGRAS